MLGKRSAQGGLFQADAMSMQHRDEDSFHGILGRMGAAWCRDEDFEGLYRGTQGPRSVPPSQLRIALLLQTDDGVSDDKAIERTAFDLRRKVALGLEISEKLCAKSTLQLFRSKLVFNGAYQQVYNKSIEVCREACVLEGWVRQRVVEDHGLGSALRIELQGLGGAILARYRNPRQGPPGTRRGMFSLDDFVIDEQSGQASRLG